MVTDKRLQIINEFKATNYEKVIKICEEIIASNRETSEIFNIYGLALQKQNLINESKKKFKKAIQLDTNNFEALNNYAISLKRSLDFDLAEKMYLRALKIKPNYIQALFNLAELHLVKQEHSKAINFYLNALRIPNNPQEIFIKIKLINAYREIGKFIEAKSVANEILKVDKNNLTAIKLLSDLTNPNEDRSVLDKMLEIKNKVALNHEELIFLSFQLGKAYERVKDYENAYKFYNEANLLKNKLTKSPILEINHLAKNIKNTFKNLKFSEFKKSYKEKKIIFIIGLPRSGTTLVEQIVSSHNEVLGTGENQILKTEIANFFYTKEKHKHVSPIIDNKLLFKEKQNNNNILQDKYFEILKKNNSELQVYTDKSIENFLFLGFIKIFFPNSKIIITERDRKDVFLSIFKNEFQTPFLNWSYDKKDILKYFEIYSDMISFWKNILLDDLYILEYEKLVEYSEIEIKNLIKFCDLSWDPNCLEPENNKTVIKTASALQARNPNYKTSKKSFENYSTFFKYIFHL